MDISEIFAFSASVEISRTPGGGEISRQKLSTDPSRLARAQRARRKIRDIEQISRIYHGYGYIRDICLLCEFGDIAHAGGR